MKNRSHIRYPLKLKVSIVNNNNNIGHYAGITKDISEHGLSIISPFNLQMENSVTLLISLHGPIIEVQGNILYTVYSSEDGSFRTGIVFNDFKRNGHNKLHKFLISKINYK